MTTPKERIGYVTDNARKALEVKSDNKISTSENYKALTASNKRITRKKSDS